MDRTFSALLFGTLLDLKELYYALAFILLLDTFVVRPILVPAFLLMLYNGTFGSWGRMLVAAHTREPQRVGEPGASAAGGSPYSDR
jgi:RND superfamily putative drug exporter